MRAFERYAFWGGVLVVLGAACYLRLAGLGDSAFRADTITFYDLCHRPVSGWTIFTHWIDLLGRTSQFPFPLAVTKGVIDILHLPPTDLVIRLPMALFGVLAVAASFFVGQAVAGRWFGLGLALLFALNPFHIQLSREAYYYAPVVAGTTLLTWSAVWAVAQRRRPTLFPWYYYVVTGLGFFLATYSHLSGWWLAALTVLVTLSVTSVRMRRTRRTAREFGILLTIFSVIALPLLFASWAVPFFVYNFMHPEVAANTRQVFGADTLPLGVMLGKLATSMAWGAAGWRSLFTVVILGLAGYAAIRQWKNRPAILVGWGFLIIGLALYRLGMLLTSTAFGARHASFLLPVYLVVLTLGIYECLNWSRWPRWGRGVLLAGLLGLAVGGMGKPALAARRLPGKPTPYKEIVRWCDTSLPSGALVLVDRWFEPWNELRVHNSTNVVFTFTIPNEPVDNYIKYRWRETARSFLDKFPDAAYLEIAKSYWEEPQVGPWDWPRQYFKRHQVFRNEPALYLQKLGLLYRDDGGKYNSRLIVDLFYNTREDVLARAAAENRSLACFYGAGWGYVKLWQQLQDFRDWRVMEGQAVIDIYNLGSAPLAGALVLRGMAVNGSKRVTAGSAFHGFKSGLLEEWTINPVMLKPGINSISLTDAFWKTGRAPLLVDSLQVIATSAQ